MLRKRYYILFVARDEDGRIRKIPLPLHYVYGFVAAALVGAFTIVGLAGSYTRMLLKTENFNQVRQDRETLRKNYQQMAQIAHDRNVQVASLGALANEVTALYGLRQNKLASAKPAAAAIAAEPTPSSLALADDVDQQQVKLSIDEFYALRSQAMSGRVSRALEGGLSSSFSGDWTGLADAPSMWPVEGPVDRASVSARIRSTAKAPFTPASILTRLMGHRSAPQPMGRSQEPSWAQDTAARSNSTMATICSLFTGIFPQWRLSPASM